MWSRVVEGPPAQNASHAVAAVARVRPLVRPQQQPELVLLQEELRDVRPEQDADPSRVVGFEAVVRGGVRPEHVGRDGRGAAARRVGASLGAGPEVIERAEHDDDAWPARPLP